MRPSTKLRYHSMNDRIRARLEDVLDAAQYIHTWAETDSLDHIVNDHQVEAAYMHEFTIIGEALRVVRDEDAFFAESIPNVHQWIGLRHRIVHDYREIDLELLWISAKEDIPTLIADLESILQ